SRRLELFSMPRELVLPRVGPIAFREVEMQEPPLVLLDAWDVRRWVVRERHGPEHEDHRDRRTLERAREVLLRVPPGHLGVVDALVRLAEHRHDPSVRMVEGELRPPAVPGARVAAQ